MFKLKNFSNKNKIEEYCEKLIEICSEEMQINICTKLYTLTKNIDENILSYLWISIASILFKFNQILPEVIDIVSLGNCNSIHCFIYLYFL